MASAIGKDDNAGSGSGKAADGSAHEMQRKLMRDVKSAVTQLAGSFIEAIQAAKVNGEITSEMETGSLQVEYYLAAMLSSARQLSSFVGKLRLCLAESLSTADNSEEIQNLDRAEDLLTTVLRGFATLFVQLADIAAGKSETCDEEFAKDMHRRCFEIEQCILKSVHVLQPFEERNAIQYADDLDAMIEKRYLQLQQSFPTLGT